MQLETKVLSKRLIRSLQIMFRVEHLYKHVQESVKVEWNLGKRCNYDCTYCPAEIHDNFSKHTDIKILKNAVDDLISSMPDLLSLIHI